MRKLFCAIFLLAAPFAASAEELVVAVMGDSLTQGYGLRQEDGLVPQLHAWLIQNDQTDVALINAGVSGDTTAGGLARVAWTLTPDVDALIVTLGGNDFLRGLDPAASRANLEGILQAARDVEVPVLLVGLSAPGNYGPEYKTAFDAIYPELAEAYGALYVPGFFDGITGEVIPGGPSPAQARPFMQADGIHPAAEGVRNIVAHLGPFVLELIAQARL